MSTTLGQLKTGDEFYPVEDILGIDAGGKIIVEGSIRIGRRFFVMCNCGGEELTLTTSDKVIPIVKLSTLKVDDRFTLREDIDGLESGDTYEVDDKTYYGDEKFYAVHSRHANDLALSVDAKVTLIED